MQIAQQDIEMQRKSIWKRNEIFLHKSDHTFDLWVLECLAPSQEPICITAEFWRIFPHSTFSQTLIEVD